MARVPTYRHRQIERLRTGRQKAIIVGGVPVPAGEDLLPLSGRQLGGFLGTEVRHEVDGKAELMRTLEGTRFRNLFFEKVRLPHRVAVRLENFEAGLRAAGFVGVDEILVQTYDAPCKFRVEKLDVVMDRHGVDPSWDFTKEVAPSGPVPSLSEVHQQRARSFALSRAKSGASLDKGKGRATRGSKTGPVQSAKRAVKPRT